MKKFFAMLALFALALTGGCKSINEIPDSQFADDIRTISYNSVYLGFKAVLNNNPGRYAQLAADVKTTTGIIRTNVYPVFTGGTTGDVLSSAIDTALAQLSVSSTVTDVVKIALMAVKMQIKLPDNPAEALSPRIKLALLGFFSGVADGLDQAVKDTPAPSPAPAVTEPTAPANKLQWNQ